MLQGYVEGTSNVGRVTNGYQWSLACNGNSGLQLYKFQNNSDLKRTSNNRLIDYWI